MNYIVNGKNITIDTSKKPFSYGSEGKLYLKNGTLYKLYNDAALNDGFGEKIYNHIGMIGIETKQIDMPENTILQMDGKYVGYTTSCITRKIKENFGITKLSKEVFLDNISTLLSDIKELTNLHILMNDVTYFNYLLNNERMYIIDPGRYRFVNKDCERQNLMQLKELLVILIYLDLCHYKVDKKRKIQIFRQSLNMDIKTTGDIYEYFYKIFEEYDLFEDYAKEKIRFIK